MATQFENPAGAHPPPFDQAGFPAFDMAKAGAFMNKMISDMSGAVASIMCTIGDRLGLFKALAGAGPATSGELAARAGIQERYAREWLSAMASEGGTSRHKVSGTPRGIGTQTPLYSPRRDEIVNNVTSWKE